jgi:hypothetical protein
VNGTTTGTGAATYSYTPANGDLIKVLLTSNAACAVPDTASSAITVTVEPLPIVAIAANPATTISAGQPVTFTATVTNGGPLPTYQWEVNGGAVAGATDAAFTSDTLSNGDIVTCVVTSSGQCSGQMGKAAVTMVVTGHVGVQAITAAGADIKVLPNPNKGTFTITGTTGSTTDEEVAIVITNMLGQEVYKGTATASSGKLHVPVSLGSNVANGMYLLNLRTGSGTDVFHIVVER